MSQISYQIERFNAPLQRNLLTIPEPTDDHVLIKVIMCGICHSDVHFLEGYFDLGDGARMDLKRMPLPMTPGHEIVGIIEKTGRLVKNVKKGDRVAVYPLLGCQKCARCRAGEEHYCNFAKFYGSSMQGGFSSHVLAHYSQVMPYGKADPAFAAVACCSGVTTFSAIKKLGKVDKDAKLLFIGAGGLGMMAVQLFKTLHPHHPGPIVADIDQTKLQLALENGASGILNLKTESDKVVNYAKGSWFGDGFTGIIDFVGSSTTVTQGAQMLNKGGALIVVGLFGGASKLSTPVFPLKGISIVGNYLGSPEEFKELMSIVQEGKIVSPPLIIRPFEDANDALFQLQKGGVAGRTVLKIDSHSSL